MGLKLKKVKEKNSIKNTESEVKLDLAVITSKKNLQEIAHYEIISMLSRLKFLAMEHKLVPVITNIELTFVPESEEGRKSEEGQPIMEAFNGKVSENLEHSIES